MFVAEQEGNASSSSQDLAWYRHSVYRLASLHNETNQERDRKEFWQRIQRVPRSRHYLLQIRDICLENLSKLLRPPFSKMLCIEQRYWLIKVFFNFKR